jgi:hypothetical protein
MEVERWEVQEIPSAINEMHDHLKLKKQTYFVFAKNE